MNRLLTAAMVAIGLHGLLLVMEFDWLKSKRFPQPATGSVTIVLETIQPQPVQPPSAPPAPRPPDPPPSKNVPPPPAVPQKPVQAVKPAPNPAPVPESPPPPRPDSRSSERPAPSDLSPAIGGPPLASLSSRPAPGPAIEEAMPEYSRNPPIPFPPSARQKGYEGTVILEVLVNPEGRVDDLKILTSSGYAVLDRSAVKSVRTWVFKPAKKGDEVVAMWVQVPVQFKLE